mgnify:CR=1 FL=1
MTVSPDGSRGRRGPVDGRSGTSRLLQTAICSLSFRRASAFRNVATAADVDSIVDVSARLGVPERRDSKSIVNRFCAAGRAAAGQGVLGVLDRRLHFCIFPLGWILVFL